MGKVRNEINRNVLHQLCCSNWGRSKSDCTRQFVDIGIFENRIGNQKVS